MNLSELVFEHGCCGAQAQVSVGDEIYMFTKRMGAPDVVGVEVYVTATGQLSKPGFEVAENLFSEFLAGL